MKDILFFTLGFIAKGAISVIATDLIVKPLSKKAYRWTKTHPIHLQPFLHYYQNHEGRASQCPICDVNTVAKS